MSSVEFRNEINKRLESVEDHLLEEILVLNEIESMGESVVKIPEHFKDTLEKSVAQKKQAILFQMTK